jgi:S1-C subfamily serine protease
MFFMKTSCRFLSISIVLILLSLPPLSRADELGDKGRAIYKKNLHSVVTIELVLKSKMSFGGGGGQSSESRQDATGTVLDASGLIVLSLAATDPSQILQSMMGSGDEDSKFKMESELSDIKILAEDGTEIPAEVVLRDKDLDLAFIRPKEKLATPMTALDLATPGEAEILDQVLALNRLGNAAGRSYAASVDRISAIVRKPRLFYVPGAGAGMSTLGAPAFTMEGKPLGIYVLRAMKSHGSGSFLGGQQDNLTSIIVPVKDINKALKQVPAWNEEKSRKPRSE